VFFDAFLPKEHLKENLEGRPYYWGTPQAGKGEKLRYLQEFSVQYGDA
jgi:hypothetical protein